MRTPGALRQNDIVGFVSTLYEGDLHAKRVLSLANATLGVLTSASLAVHAIGQGLAHAQGTLSKHGVKQVDRLLSNRGIELDAYFAHWVPYVIGARKEVVVALDWTSFARDGVPEIDGGWPQVDPAAPQLMRLGPESAVVGADSFRAQRCQALAELEVRLGRVPAS